MIAAFIDHLAHHKALAGFFVFETVLLVALMIKSNKQVSELDTEEEAEEMSMSGTVTASLKPSDYVVNVSVTFS